MAAAILVLFAYLLGSIPCAYIAGRLIKGVDITTIGDHNAGAANVYRNISHRAGIAVAAGDTAKGAISVLVAQAIASQPVVLLCGVAAVVGHNWPLFCRFRGGRGQATTLGVLLTLMPMAMGIKVSSMRGALLGYSQYDVGWCYPVFPLVVVGLAYGSVRCSCWL